MSPVGSHTQPVQYKQCVKVITLNTITCSTTKEKKWEVKCHRSRRFMLVTFYWVVKKEFWSVLKIVFLCLILSPRLLQTEHISDFKVLFFGISSFDLRCLLFAFDSHACAYNAFFFAIWNCETENFTLPFPPMPNRQQTSKAVVAEKWEKKVVLH